MYLYWILEVNFTIDQLFCWSCSWINQLIYYTWCTINLNWFRETHLLHRVRTDPAFVKWKSTFHSHVRFGQFWLFSKYRMKNYRNLLKWNEILWLLLLLNSRIFAFNIHFIKVTIIQYKQNCAASCNSPLIGRLKCFLDSALENIIIRLKPINKHRRKSNRLKLPEISGFENKKVNSEFDMCIVHAVNCGKL